MVVATAAGAQEKPKSEGPDSTGFWTAAELDLLDRGLDAINATRVDLAFQKRPIDDPFRLDVVNRALDDPLSVGREAQAWDDAARDGNLLQCALETLGSMEHSFPSSSFISGPSPLEAAVPEGSWTSIQRAAGYAAGTTIGSGPLKEGPGRDALLRKMLLKQVEKPNWVIDAPDLKDEEFFAAAAAADFRFERELEMHTYIRAASVVTNLKERMKAGHSRWSGRREDKELRLVIYGYGDDVHEADEGAGLVLDLGGNDTWTRGASASVLKNRPVSVCIDLAGNDRYVGREDLSFGAALGGLAIQWDCAGDDLYDAGHASLGAGICGVGVLVDEGGDDVYRCRDFGIGAGAFGIGVFLDKGGNDLYHCDLYGEGFASTRGCGVLVDMAGNDVYDAGGVHVHAPLYADRHQSLSQGFSIGMRPDASGGVGVLVDLKGNDRYMADIYGQGASYWYSLGILVDDDGNDTYNLGQYGQGSGIHLSAGILVDRAGSDLYYLKNGVGMGGAHDYAVGMLVDRGGDDYYAGSGGTQGGALTNSVAILLDGGGNDGYAAVQEGAQGYASPARGTGGIGLLLDAGGKDVHTERERDETTWSKELVGAGVDDPSPPVEGGVGDPGATSITPEKAKEAVDRDGMVDGPDGKRVDDLEKLWEIAKRWEVGDERVIVPIARERLVALGTPALEKALARVGDRQGLEFRACQAMFAKFPKEVVVPRLVERTKDADLWVRRRSVTALADLRDEAAMPRLLEMLEKDAEVRSTVLGALAGMKKAPPQVAGYLRSAKEADGVQAALCLASVGDEAAVQALLGALGHDHAYPVRLAALDRLGAMGAAAVPTLTLFVEDETRSVPARRNALRALARSKDPAASLPILDSLRSPERGLRLSAYMAAGELAKSLGAEDAKVLTDAAAEARVKETDPFLRRAR